MIELIAKGPIPTNYGLFQMYLFRETGKPQEHVAMVFGRLDEHDDAIVRVHSACVTGEIFRANNCDCRQQLDMALQAITAYGAGALLYLDQEGRGNGLGPKLETFELIVNGGVDPSKAFRMLGYPEDLRDYSIAAEMLLAIGIDYPIKLLTNNPKKVDDLEKAGVRISERLDLYIPPSNEMMKKNFTSKRDQFGHYLPDDIKVTDE